VQRKLNQQKVVFEAAVRVEAAVEVSRQCVKELLMLLTLLMNIHE
jgi:hypothetical protein